MLYIGAPNKVPEASPKPPKYHTFLILILILTKSLTKQPSINRKTTGQRQALVLVVVQFKLGKLRQAMGSASSETVEEREELDSRGPACLTLPRRG